MKKTCKMVFKIERLVYLVQRRVRITATMVYKSQVIWADGRHEENVFVPRRFYLGFHQGRRAFGRFEAFLAIAKK